MSANTSKKTVFGPNKSHVRIQIDVPAQDHAMYKLWCALNRTDMTEDVIAHIREMINQPGMPKIVDAPRHKPPARAGKKKG